MTFKERPFLSFVLGAVMGGWQKGSGSGKGVRVIDEVFVVVVVA